MPVKPQHSTEDWVTVGGAEYRYSISLRVTHPSRSLDDLTAELGIVPSRTWRAGEPRTTPRGEPLNGLYGEHYWTARLVDGVSTDRNLATALAAVLDKLFVKKEFIASLSKSGGRSEFFIGWFFDEGNSGDVLSSTLLGKLADFCIDLSFDVYP
jgi:hypothetical protein